MEYFNRLLGFAGNFTASSTGANGLTLNPASGAIAAGGTQSLGVSWSSASSVGPQSGQISIANTSNGSDSSNHIQNVSGMVYSGQSVWNGNGNGNGTWGTLVSSFGTNWGANQGSPGLDPNFTTSDTATFNTAGAGATLDPTITLDGANPSLKSIIFNTSESVVYTISPGTGGAITLNGGAGSAAVTDSGGSNIIDVPITLATNANLSVANSTDILLIISPISGNGFGITIGGNGVVSLAGANSYTGATTVSSGTLQQLGGSLGNTAISVNGGTFWPSSTSAGTTGASLTLSSGNLFLKEGSGNFTVSGTGAVVNLGGGQITFALGSTSSGVQELVASGGSVNVSGATSIAITDLPTNSSGLATSYNLITGASLSGATNLTLANSTLLVGSTTYNLSLSTSGGNTEVLTATPSLGNLYWNGSVDGGWNRGSGGGSTNWQSSASANPNAPVPTSTSNVYFTANSANNLTTALNAPFSINSLTFTGAGTTAGSSSVTINSGTGGTNSTLTIGAGGIMVQTGSADHTINAPIVLAANQTWTVTDPTNTLTVGNVTGNGFGIALGGNGTVLLTGAESYTGATTISSGTLEQQGGSLGNTAISVNGGTFSPSSTSAGTTGASLTLDSGNLLLKDGSGNFTVSGTGAVVNLGGGQITFALGSTSSGVQELVASGGSVNVSGATSIAITDLPGNSSGLATSYNLIAGASLSGATNLTLANTTLVVGSTTYSLGLSTSGGNTEILTATPSVSNFYWTGNAAASDWNAMSAGASNWSADSAGANDAGGAKMNSATTVYFTASSAVPGPITANLDAAYAVNGLVFNGNNGAGNSVTVGADSIANTLTISSGGVTVNNGVGSVTIGAPVILAANQVWTNNSASLLTAGSVAMGGFSLTAAGSGNITINGPISGSGGLTVTNSGTNVSTTLDAVNTYTGATNITNSSVILSTNGVLGAGIGGGTAITVSASTGNAYLATNAVNAITGASSLSIISTNFDYVEVQLGAANNFTGSLTTAGPANTTTTSLLLDVVNAIANTSSVTFGDSMLLADNDLSAGVPSSVLKYSISAAKRGDASFCFLAVF